MVRVCGSFVFLEFGEQQSGRYSLLPGRGASIASSGTLERPTLPLERPTGPDREGGDVEPQHDRTEDVLENAAKLKQ
mgnify:CR=1 FL=1